MKAYLGKVRDTYKPDTVAGEKIYLANHSWDCDWYWGFGYVGNHRLHTHFDGAFLTSETDVNKIFLDPQVDQKTWWVLRDLFIQAYALKKAAEVYRHGGYQTTVAGVTDMLRNTEMCNRLNADLKTVLDQIWKIVS